MYQKWIVKFYAEDFLNDVQLLGKVVKLDSNLKTFANNQHYSSVENHLQHFLFGWFR